MAQKLRTPAKPTFEVPVTFVIPGPDRVVLNFVAEYRRLPKSEKKAMELRLRRGAEIRATLSKAEADPELEATPEYRVAKAISLAWADPEYEKTPEYQAATQSVADKPKPLDGDTGALDVVLVNWRDLDAEDGSPFLCNRENRLAAEDDWGGGFEFALSKAYVENNDVAAEKNSVAPPVSP